MRKTLFAITLGLTGILAACGGGTGTDGSSLAPIESAPGLESLPAESMPAESMPAESMPVESPSAS